MALYRVLPNDLPCIHKAQNLDRRDSKGEVSSDLFLPHNQTTHLQRLKVHTWKASAHARPAEFPGKRCWQEANFSRDDVATRPSPGTWQVRPPRPLAPRAGPGPALITARPDRLRAVGGRGLLATCCGSRLSSFRSPTLRTLTSFGSSQDPRAFAPSPAKDGAGFAHLGGAQPPRPSLFRSPSLSRRTASPHQAAPGSRSPGYFQPQLHKLSEPGT